MLRKTFVVFSALLAAVGGIRADIVVSDWQMTAGQLSFKLKGTIPAGTNSPNFNASQLIIGIQDKNKRWFDEFGTGIEGGTIVNHDASTVQLNFNAFNSGDAILSDSPGLHVFAAMPKSDSSQLQPGDTFDATVTINVASNDVTFFPAVTDGTDIVVVWGLVNTPSNWFSNNRIIGGYAANTAPVVTLDSPTTANVTIPNGVGLLLETTSVDGESDPLTYSWSQVSDPGTATFVSPTSDDSGVNFSAPGSYTLRLTVNDGASDATSDVAVEVLTTSTLVKAPNVSGGLVYYSFDESGNMTVPDGFGGDNPGSPSEGILTGETGVLKTAWRFDGATDSIKIPNSMQINNTVVQKRSVSLWFKPDGLSNGRQILFEEGGASRGFSIYLDNDILYVGGWNNGENGWNETFLGARILDTGWHHVVFTLDAPDPSSGLGVNALKYYLDGNLVKQGDAATMNAHNNPSGIGGRAEATKMHDGVPTQDHYFDGLIDEFFLTNEVMSAAEVTAEYHLAASGNVGAYVNIGADYLLAPLEYIVKPVVSDDRFGANLTLTQVSGPSAGIDPSFLVLFTAEGDYVFRMIADDGFVKTFDDVSYTYAEDAELVHFNNWMADFATSGAITPSDDYDQDGRSNLEEYAAGTDPSVAIEDGMPLISTSVSVTALETTVSFTLRRRKDSFERGLIYQAHTCSDLVNWVSSGAIEIAVTDAPLPGFEDVLYEVKMPLGDTDGRVFVRAKIQLAE